MLDEVANRPFNPMVNAGAIAYMMLNTGMIKRDPGGVLDLYFRQCSVNVTARDLAIMAATLANDGTNPITGETLYEAQYVRDLLTVMNSCGMYDYAGEWAYEVGMAAKSGVSGCIIAVIPGQIGLAVLSPPIDAIGNSVRGIRVCQEISKAFELHVFNNRTNVRSVIRRDYRADVVRSNRLRTPEERKILAEKGGEVAVLEARRQALGRHRRRRAGDLLRAQGRAAARAHGRASQHHDHHSRQSDARVLRAPAPCQRGDGVLE